MRPVWSGEPLAKKMPMRPDTTSSACTSERRLPSSAPARSSMSTAPAMLSRVWLGCMAPESNIACSDSAIPRLAATKLA